MNLAPIADAQLAIKTPPDDDDGLTLLPGRLLHHVFFG
jgi:hypothetical protein